MPGLTDAGVARLAGLAKLRGLDLSNCRVTDAGLMSLRGLSNLLSLKLWGCEGVNRGAAELRRNLPGCAIDLGF